MKKCSQDLMIFKFRQGLGFASGEAIFEAMES